MTRLEQVGRTRHFLSLRERLRHGHENTVAPNDFTKTEKVGLIEINNIVNSLYIPPHRKRFTGLAR